MGDNPAEDPELGAQDEAMDIAEELRRAQEARANEAAQHVARRDRQLLAAHAMLRRMNGVLADMIEQMRPIRQLIQANAGVDAVPLILAEGSPIVFRETLHRLAQVSGGQQGNGLRATLRAIRRGRGRWPRY